jgi:hypothetical protein
MIKALLSVRPRNGEGAISMARVQAGFLPPEHVATRHAAVEGRENF